MSRGPGSFQMDILDRIQRNRGMISWDELKDSFPLRVENRSLHRATRSLRKMGYLREVKADGRRLFAYCLPRGMSKADRALLDSCKEVAWLLRMAAKARGVAVPSQAAELDAFVDAYRRETFFGDKVTTLSLGPRHRVELLYANQFNRTHNPHIYGLSTLTISRYRGTLLQTTESPDRITSG